MSSASVLTIETAASGGSGLSLGRLERLFAEQHSLVWRTLRRLGLSEARAADMTQLVFSRAAKELGGIARQDERVQVLRLALRGLSHDEALGARARVTAVLQPSDARRTPIDRVLRTMSRPGVIVFILFELEGLALDEIAQALGMDAEEALQELLRARLEFTPRVAELRGRGTK